MFLASLAKNADIIAASMGAVALFGVFRVLTLRLSGPLGPHAAVRRWAAYSSNHEFQQFNLTT